MEHREYKLKLKILKKKRIQINAHNERLEVTQCDQMLCNIQTNIHSTRIAYAPIRTHTKDDQSGRFSFRPSNYNYIIIIIIIWQCSLFKLHKQHTHAHTYKTSNIHKWVKSWTVWLGWMNGCAYRIVLAWWGCICNWSSHIIYLGIILIFLFNSHFVFGLEGLLSIGHTLLLGHFHGIWNECEQTGFWGMKWNEK